MVEVRRAGIGEILPLRHRVLRTGFPIDAARFTEDLDESTLHYGLFVDGEARVCLTLIANSLDGEKAWQLRGMAADVGVQGKGYGGRLIQFALEDALAEEYSSLFWCNARKSAARFYEQNGWKIISEEFMVPVFGPHFRMFNAAEQR
jgi:N-acetylglutamate synthase-like GNAT family acetyltransferase